MDTGGGKGRQRQRLRSRETEVVVWGEKKGQRIKDRGRDTEGQRHQVKQREDKRGKEMGREA